MSSDYQKTGYPVLDDRLKKGIKSGSTVILLYDSSNHGVNLHENLATGDIKTRYISSSRGPLQMENSLINLTSEDYFNEHIKIISTPIRDLFEKIKDEVVDTKSENVIVEDISSALDFYDDNKKIQESLQYLKKSENRMQKTNQILYLGVDKSNSNNSIIRPILSSADGVLELKTIESEGSIINYIIIRRMPEESDLPTSTTVKITDDLEKAGEEDL